MKRLFGILVLVLTTTVFYSCGGGGGGGSATAPVPDMPVIQSLSLSGAPASPGGTVTATVNVQGGQGLSLTYSLVCHERLVNFKRGYHERCDHYCALSATPQQAPPP